MKVAISDPIAKEGVEFLKSKGVEVLDLTEIPKEQLGKHLGDADALIVRSATKVTKDLIDSAPKLKVIGRAGVGLDNVDVEYAKAKGITVVNTPGATSISVAELTIGLILAVYRKIAYADRETRKGNWPKKKCEGLEIYGKKAGIVGLGKIGIEVAKRLKALGCEVYYYKRTPLSQQEEQQLGIKYLDLDTLISTCDIITLHVPLTPETKKLINAERIAKMKEGAVLINTSRGGIIDEDALYNALKTGKLYGAGLDVFEVEPLKESKLFELENVVLTPHIGAQAEEGQIRAGIEIAYKVYDLLVEKIKR